MATSRLPVVAGVDGTEHSVSLLRWSAFEAVLRGTGVVAVHAFGVSFTAAPYAPAHISLSPDSAAAQAIARLDQCLWQAFDGHPPVPVRTVCDNRRPVPALLDHGRNAALLVLGARADPVRGGVALGPVARDCLRRAPCPIVLLPITLDLAVAATSRSAASAALPRWPHTFTPHAARLQKASR
jgi:nucleotide-binding universal stress UspA family protein